MWFICNLGCAFPSVQCLKKWVNGNILNSPEQSCSQPLSWPWTSKKCYGNKRLWKQTSLFAVWRFLYDRCLLTFASGSVCAYGVWKCVGLPLQCCLLKIAHNFRDPGLVVGSEKQRVITQASIVLIAPCGVVITVLHCSWAASSICSATEVFLFPALC